MHFRFRFEPAPKHGGFAMDDYWIWCGSAIRGDDGQYHLFASRWPKRYPFYNGYVCYSEIVRAVADNPLGPFTFVDVVVPTRDLHFWDGGHTHNPTIHRIGGRYCLFYEAITFPKGRPSDREIRNGGPMRGGSYPAIGLCIADSLDGPWQRFDRPALAQRDGAWDREIVTNPAVCEAPDGRILLYYRSYDMTVGLAEADEPEGPYRRIGDGPLPSLQPPNRVEDMYVWHSGEHFEMLAKDCTGGVLSGERGAGVHATSPDGVAWIFSDPVKAYSRTIAWDDGSVASQGCLERAQLLIEDGEPRALYAATGDGPGGFNACTRTWNMAISLEPQK